MDLVEHGGSAQAGLMTTRRCHATTCRSEPKARKRTHPDRGPHYRDDSDSSRCSE